MDHKVYHAIWNDNIDEAVKLIENAFIENTVSCNPLHLACEKGYLEIVKLLVEKKGLNIDQYSCPGAQIYEYPLSLACKKSHFDIVKYLVEKGANINIKRNWVFLSACEGGDLQIVKYLIDNESEILNGSINCPLRIASYHGNYEVAKYLFENKYYLNLNDALLSACNGNNLNIVNLLVENGADVNHQKEGYDYVITPLVNACNKKNLNIVKYLVENGANIHIDNNIVIKKVSHYKIQYSYKKIPQNINPHKIMFSVFDNPLCMLYLINKGSDFLVLSKDKINVIINYLYLEGKFDLLYDKLKNYDQLNDDILNSLNKIQQSRNLFKNKKIFKYDTLFLFNN